MTTPYRTAAIIPTDREPLPAMAHRCPFCGVDRLRILGAYQLLEDEIRVRQCSWWKRLWGCREARLHVHCEHGSCKGKWVARPAGHGEK